MCAQQFKYDYMVDIYKFGMYFAQYIENMKLKEMTN